MNSKTIEPHGIVTTNLLEQLTESLKPFGVLVTGEPHGSNPSLVRSLTFSTVQHQRRTPLIAVHGGHVFGGTWSDFTTSEEAHCEACGHTVRAAYTNITTGCPPCSGWRSTGGADALPRIVRGLTYNTRDSAPRTNRENARSIFGWALDRSTARDALARAWQAFAQADADEARALHLAIEAQEPAWIASRNAPTGAPLSEEERAMAEESERCLGARAERIMAHLRALPVDPDGRTPEDDAIFDQIETDSRKGAT